MILPSVRLLLLKSIISLEIMLKGNNIIAKIEFEVHNNEAPKNKMIVQMQEFGELFWSFLGTQAPTKRKQQQTVHTRRQQE